MRRPYGSFLVRLGCSGRNLTRFLAFHRLLALFAAHLGKPGSACRIGIHFSAGRLRGRFAMHGFCPFFIRIGRLRPTLAAFCRSPRLRSRLVRAWLCSRGRGLIAVILGCRVVVCRRPMTIGRNRRVVRSFGRVTFGRRRLLAGTEDHAAYGTQQTTAILGCDLVPMPFGGSSVAFGRRFFAMSATAFTVAA